MITNLEFIVDKKFILERVSPEEIFCKYFPLDGINFKYLYKNPLREDNTPGCRFYVNKSSGILYFKDFKWRSWDCFDFIKAQYVLTFEEILFKIAVDFNLLGDSGTDSTNLKLREKVINAKRQEKPIITYNIRGWHKSDIDWWRRYISWLDKKDMESYNIYPLLEYFIGDERMEYNLSKPYFVYVFSKYSFQLYMPKYKLRKRSRFISTEERIFGTKSYDKNESYIVVAKSYKCFFLMRMLGINCIGVLSETIRELPQEVIDILNSFDQSFTLFDNDYAGKKASIYFKLEYGTIPLIFPSDLEKDFSDNLLKYGEREVNELIEEVKEYYNL